MQRKLGKGIKFLLSVFAFFLITSSAHASKLPDDLWLYIKEQLPNASQRFDSVVVVSSEVMYIPLYPAQASSVDEIKIDYTYPSGKNLTQSPEVVVFNNNFALLKLFKDKKGNYTITSYQDVPMKVKLGIMPQDMLVPPGLKMPDNLKMILGDLLIPSKEDGNLILTADKKDVNSPEPLLENELIPMVELKNKKTYITTSKSKFMYVFDETSKAPLYELKLSGLPSKIVASNNTKFALVVYFANKNLEVIDLKNERIVSQIPLDDTAKDVDVDLKKDVAYVSSQNAKTIYCVDLNSAKLIKAIRLEQSPSRLALSSDGNYLAFVDGLTGELFGLKLDKDVQVNPIAKIKNVSKLICDDKNIYAISRVQNKMYVYNRETFALLDEENLNEKPTDAVLYNGKIFILCAKEGVMDVYDTLSAKITNSQHLEGEGFYSKITPVPNQSNAIITGINSKKFILFDLDKIMTVKKQPAQIDVANMVVVDKTPMQDL